MTARHRTVPREVPFDAGLAPNRHILWRVLAIFLSGIPLITVFTVFWDFPLPAVTMTLLLIAVASIINTTVATFHFTGIYFSFQKLVIVVAALGISFGGVTSLLHPLMLVFALPFLPAFFGLLGSLSIMYPLAWRNTSFYDLCLFATVMTIPGSLVLALTWN